MSMLDIERHEVNPLVVNLSRKIGLRFTFIITWLIFAIPIATIDSTIFWKMLGAPVLAFIFGFIHILASMNNMGLYFQTKEFGVDAMEYNTQLIIDNLKRLSFVGKLKYLVKMNFFNAALSIYTMSIVIVLWFSILMHFQYYMIMGLTMNVSLLTFFPTITFGMILISFRRLKLKGYSKSITAEEGSITVSVNVLEQAIAEAKQQNAEFVSFSIPKEGNK
jgi:hypothetical protein